MADPVGLVNWRRLSERVTTSGQPGEADLAAIAGLGVRTVINLGLHTHERALPDEAASAAALGLAYVHIPVDFKQPTEADFGRFCEAMAVAAGPVHVHCIMNWRVSAFFYRYHRDVAGVPEPVARAELAQVWQPDAVWSGFIRLGAPA